MEKVFNTYAARKGIDSNALRFLLDGLVRRGREEGKEGGREGGRGGGEMTSSAALGLPLPFTLFSLFLLTITCGGKKEGREERKEGGRNDEPNDSGRRFYFILQRIEKHQTHEELDLEDEDQVRREGGREGGRGGRRGRQVRCKDVYILRCRQVREIGKE